MSPRTERAVGYVAADIEDLTPEQLIETLAAAGYGAVDWTMEQFDPLEEPDSVLVWLAERARAAGLATPQLMVHQDYVTPDPAEWERRVRRSERAVEAAAAAGIPSIGVVTGPNRWVDGWTPIDDSTRPDGIGIERAWGLAQRALERVLRRAEAVGVMVALEPCWGTVTDDRATADRMLAALACPALGVTFDPSHFVMTGDDVGAMVDAWAERIVHVHLKDAFGRPGMPDEDFTFLLPGEGAVDWASLLGALDRAGYAGAMSVEFESFRLRDGALGGDVRRGAELARSLVSGVIDGVRANRAKTA